MCSTELKAEFLGRTPHVSIVLFSEKPWENLQTQELSKQSLVWWSFAELCPTPGISMWSPSWRILEGPWLGFLVESLESEDFQKLAESPVSN